MRSFPRCYRRRSTGSSGLTASGRIEYIVADMRKHFYHERVQKRACATLGQLCKDNADNSVALASAGGIAALVLAMQEHPHDVTINRLACGALRNAMFDNTQLSNLVLETPGSVESIVAAMNLDLNHASLQRKGCGALMALSMLRSQALVVVVESSRGAIMVAAVLYAMHAHPKDAVIQQKGLGVLSDIAAVDNEAFVRVAAAIEASSPLQFRGGHSGQIFWLATVLAAETAHPKDSIIAQRVSYLIKVTDVCTAEESFFVSGSEPHQEAVLRLVVHNSMAAPVAQVL